MSKLLILILTATAFLTITCKKAKVYGCTDKHSISYNFKANEQCFSCCEYQGSCVFYANFATSEMLKSNNVTSWSLKVNTYFIDSSRNTYFTVAPQCGDAAAISFSSGLAFEKSNDMGYELLDQDGNLIKQGDFHMKADTCLAYEIGAL
ncbi:MAG: hypothetical protein H7321_02560 [Bacteroidia bacterium]|nr:hypothetical protein [Bacteroidia bacterium]